MVQLYYRYNGREGVVPQVYRKKRYISRERPIVLLVLLKNI